MIRILIVDDSEVVTLLLKAIFEEQPDMEVIACATNGREAVDMISRLKPDLVTMDIQMPVLDGLAATREIMSTNPVPIIIVSSAVAGKDGEASFNAIEQGALWVIEKPPGISHPNFDLVRRELVDTARAMAGMKLVKRKNNGTRDVPAKSIESDFRLQSDSKMSSCELVVIGCSTGGPQAMQKIISQLPAEFPLPIAVVQHISNGFTAGMVSWLQMTTELTIKIAEHGEVLQPATIYYAPDDEHLSIKRIDNTLTANLDRGAQVNRFRPSATPLLDSVAHTCPRTALGVLLTGMGQDGAQGLLAMRKAGCHTIVQDKESCVVFGMPGTALELEAVDKIVPLADMAKYLNSVAHDCAQTLTAVKR